MVLTFSGAVGLCLVLAAIQQSPRLKEYLYSLRVARIYRRRLQVLAGGVCLLGLTGAASVFLNVHNERSIQTLEMQNRELTEKLVGVTHELIVLREAGTSSDKNVGTVPQTRLTISEHPIAEVAVDSLAVRDQPKGRQIGRLPRGQRVQILSPSNPAAGEWVSVHDRMTNVRGWVARAYLKP